MQKRHIWARVGHSALAVLALNAFAANFVRAEPFIPKLVTSSTIPSNGDNNPYGVAFVPRGFPEGGLIKTGDVLVSDFNNDKNLQGTGTSIICFTPTGPVAPPGAADTFFTSTLPGLSTALGVLRGGFVIVGNVPTSDGTFATIGQGALQVIDRNGHLVQTFTDPVMLDGPWDLAIDDDGPFAHIFISNVLNGTVSRLDVLVGPDKLTLLRKTTIATGYAHRPDDAALVLGPTGLAFDERTDTLYVAATADNAVYAVPNASVTTTAVTKGALVFDDSHLRGPLALRFAPNGHLLTANGDAVNPDPTQPSEIVEFTRFGRFVRQYDVDPVQGGAFGLDTVNEPFAPFNYAAVDDIPCYVSVYKLPIR